MTTGAVAFYVFAFRGYVVSASGNSKAVATASYGSSLLFSWCRVDENSRMAVSHTSTSYASSSYYWNLRDGDLILEGCGGW